SGDLHGGRKRPNVLTLLCNTMDEEGNPMNIEEIKVQMILLLFAGHETTASMLTSSLLVLAQRRDMLQVLRREQADAIKSYGSEITLEALSCTPHLDNFLKEVERMYPPILGAFRHVVEDVDVYGYQVKKGSRIMRSILSSHRDPALFKEPNQFDPARFAEPRSEHLKHSFALQGYGGGPRKCLGAAFAVTEMKVCLAVWLRSYQWRLKPGQDLTMLTAPTLHPADGLRADFAKRERSRLD
ncbi:hypothetical protein CYMTET_41831, partial [Cymbomonas tetramitiformis]